MKEFGMTRLHVAIFNRFAGFRWVSGPKQFNYVGRLVRAFRGIGFPLPADVSRTPCGGGVPEDRTHTAPSRTGSDPVRTTGHGRHRLGSSRWRSSRGPPRMGLLPAARCSWASFRWGFSRGRLFSGRLIAAISSAPGLIHGALLWRGHFGPSRSIPPFPPTLNCGVTGVWTRSDIERNIRNEKSKEEQESSGK